MREDQPLDSYGALDMQLDGGYISPFFVTEITDDGEEIAVLEEPLILVVEEKLSSLDQMLPLLESIIVSGQQLLIIGGGVEGYALETLVLNKTRGGLKAAAVEVLCHADLRRTILKDIARLTGGLLIERNLGIDLERVTVSMLGKAKKVRIEENKTVILGGAGRPLRPKGAPSIGSRGASSGELQILGSAPKTMPPAASGGIMPDTRPLGPRSLQRASAETIRATIAAVYDHAAANNMKPPNLKEITKHVLKRLEHDGWVATENYIQKLATERRYADRRLKIGEKAAKFRPFSDLEN